MKTKVKIESKMAESANDALRPSYDPAPYSVTEWEGEVDLDPFKMHNNNEIDNRLEAVFRAFNRVDQSDVDRLTRWGYELPSLSVGDLVTLDRPGPTHTYKVGGFGFERVD